MYRIYLQQGDNQILFPLAPAELTIQTGCGNKVVELVNLGQVNLLKEIGLRDISFEAVFPGKKRSYVSYGRKEPFYEPDYYLGMLRQFQESKEPATLIICRELADGTRLFDDHFQVSVEGFTATEKGGEEGDVHVMVRLKEYRSIGSILYHATQSASGSTVLRETTVQTAAKIKNTYTVKKGDTLWKIAKEMLGDGSRYQEIAKANGISNPDLIYAGQVLIWED